jgi:hypothetical protein
MAPHVRGCVLMRPSEQRCHMSAAHLRTWRSREAQALTNKVRRVVSVDEVGHHQGHGAQEGHQVGCQPHGQLLNRPCKVVGCVNGKSAAPTQPVCRNTPHI